MKLIVKDKHVKISGSAYDFTVKSVMNTSLKQLNDSDALVKACRMFETFDLHHLPVLRNSQIVGIFSYSDWKILEGGKNTIAPEKWEEMLKFPIKEYMTADPICIDPTCTIIDAAKLLNSTRFRALPVCLNGTLVGIVTSTDIVHYLIKIIESKP